MLKSGEPFAFAGLWESWNNPNDERVLAGAGDSAFKTPDRIEESTGPDLVDTTNEADMLVITHPDVVGDPPTATFTSYIAHREAVLAIREGTKPTVAESARGRKD
jgi:hypothetical protein